MIVLKISCNGEIHRIQFEVAPDQTCIRRAVQELWPRSEIQWIKYVDEEGDLCTLVEATFTDFMQTALQGSHGRQLLKVEVGCTTNPLAKKKKGLSVEELGFVEVFPAMLNSHSVDACASSEVAEVESALLSLESDCETIGDSEQPEVLSRGAKRSREEDDEEEVAEEEPVQEELAEEEQFLEEWELVAFDQLDANASSVNASSDPNAQSSDAAPEPEDDEMAEIRAEMERIKLACEAELERHLEEWLITRQSEPTFEGWIADVHPENVKLSTDSIQVVDARMYLENSFHRLLWNTRTAAFEGMSPAQQRQCYVDPREPFSAAVLCESPSALSE